MRIFLLAAGSSSRWKSLIDPKLLPEDKFMVDIFGTPLVERTIKQLIDNNYPFTLVTRNEYLKKSFEHFCDVVVPRHESDAVIDSLRLTWQSESDAIYLLGDVCYSMRSLKLCILYRDEIEFFGNRNEIFSVSIKKHRAKDFNEALTKTYYLRGYNLITGKLRDLRWVLNHKIPENLKNETLSRIRDPHFHIIKDFTRDFDRPKGYYAFIGSAKIERLIREGR